MMQGIASSGYVVYVTAIFPYIVLTIFFFRGITLKGALAGLHHMFSPKVHCKKTSRLGTGKYITFFTV
jgi:solute carrier family 6 amino acid/orphan transporter-like 15/16/17/18/20